MRILTQDQALVFLRKARDLIKKGWVKGTMTDNAGCFCALGAIREVTGAAVWAGASLDTVDRYYDVVDVFSTESGIRDITHWNDSFDISQSDVVSEFSRVIKKLGDKVRRKANKEKFHD